jgi:hypothetical protein
MEPHQQPLRFQRRHATCVAVVPNCSPYVSALLSMPVGG